MTTQTRTAKAVQRAYSFIEIKSVDEEKRIIRGIATTPTTDLVGDIVEPMGGEFKLPLPLLLHHNHEMPVGEVTWAKATKAGIEFEARLARIDEQGTVKARLDEAWHSLKAKLIRAVSIGFKNLEHTVMENGGWKFVKWSWLELSLVTVPANPDATIHTIRSIDRELRGASAREKPNGRLHPAGVSASPQSQKSGNTKMTISEQISALEAERTNLKAALKKFDVDNMSEADEERFDELEADLDAKTKKLNRLKKIEAIDLDKATPVVATKAAADAPAARNGGGNYQRYAARPVEAPKGINFARSVICLANAQGNTELAAMLAEKHYADDKRIANFLRLKAAVPAAYTGDGSGWAEDIAEANTIGSEFIDYLRPMTIVDRLNGFRRVPFNVKVTRQTTGQGGYWVGEALPTALTSGVFDTVTMGKTKVGAISVMSKEQMRFSNINAEATIRDDLAAAVVNKLDSTFIGTAAASAGVSPAGLLNGVSAQSTNGATADDLREDLGILYRLLDAANIDLDGVSFVTTGRLKKGISLMRSSLGIAEFPGADSGTLDGQPFIGSNHVGGGDLVAISTKDILLADDGQVDVSMSDQASLEMLDASLQQDATAGTGASVVSLWQSGLVAIKCERFINWQKARSAAVQFIGNAAYLGVTSA